jgi:hypothetical protein
MKMTIFCLVSKKKVDIENKRVAFNVDFALAEVGNRQGERNMYRGTSCTFSLNHRTVRLVCPFSFQNLQRVGTD